MKLSQTISIVVLVHLGVIGTLFIFPGCQMGQIRPQGDRLTGYPKGEVSHQEAPPVSPGPSVARFEPTRPTWNLSSESEPELIEGLLIHNEANSFNAILPETLDDNEVVLVVPEASVPFTGTYVVVQGDNLTRIARAQGVRLSELMAANELDKTAVLQIGQELIIPAPSVLVGPEASVAPAYSPTAVDLQGEAYKVQAGDTLGGIAKRFRTTVVALQSANQLTGDAIYIGQTLLIPSGSSGAAAPASPLVEPRTNETAYVVQAGDTLGGIAKRYGLSVRQLAERNHIRDPRKLRTGAALVIPSQEFVAPPLNESLSASSPVSTLNTQPEPVAVVEVEPEPESVFIEVDEYDFDDLDSIPLVPVETTTVPDSFSSEP